MAQPIRRIVTGHDADGRSIFISDAPSEHVRESPNGRAVTELWVTDSSPADNSGNADAAAVPSVLPPPPNGSRFRVVEYPPDSVRFAGGEDAADRDVGSGRSHATDTARHPGMHKTDTIDYAIVLSGEIYAMMDEGETLMRPGDVLIQRGTSHAWSNRSDAPCCVAFVLIDAVPV